MAKPRQPIKLEEHTISDPATGYSRPIHLLRGPADQPHRLCLFLDGELYLQKMKVVPVLNAIRDHSALPPVTFAFIDHLNMKARGEDYTCNDKFGRFVGEKVIPWLQSEIPGLQPGEHLIGGLSLSGLASAWLALQYPGHFRYCLSQSGSFWWNDQHFAKMALQRTPLERLKKYCGHEERGFLGLGEALAKAQVSTNPVTEPKRSPNPKRPLSIPSQPHGYSISLTALKNNRFWLSVGDQETEVDEPPEVSQLVGVKHAHHILKSLGATVHYHEYHGGHDLKYWRAELEQALLWLLGGNND